jgi:hypothetical protein
MGYLNLLKNMIYLIEDGWSLDQVRLGGDDGVTLHLPMA